MIHEQARSHGGELKNRFVPRGGLRVGRAAARAKNRVSVYRVDHCTVR